MRIYKIHDVVAATGVSSVTVQMLGAGRVVGVQYSYTSTVVGTGQEQFDLTNGSYNSSDDNDANGVIATFVVTGASGISAQQTGYLPCDYAVSQGDLLRLVGTRISGTESVTVSMLIYVK